MKKNKIYDAIDMIKLNEGDKERMYNNIIEKNKKGGRVSIFRKVAQMAAVAVFVFVVTIGSVYAMAKIFNWDSNLLEFFGINEKDVEKSGIDSTEVNESSTKDDMTVVVKQLVSINNVWYATMEINYAKPNNELNMMNTEKIFCNAWLVTDKSEEFVWGFVEILSINEDKTKAIVVVRYEDEEIMKLIDNNSTVKFQFAIGERVYTENVGVCPENHIEIEWFTKELVTNNSKFDYVFDNIFVKDTKEVVIGVNTLKVTPVDIKLSLRLYGLENREFVSLTDDELKFEKTVDIVFKDKTVIKLDGYYDDSSKLVQGSNRVGRENDTDDYYVMELTYSNMLTQNPYSDVEFKLIDVDNIEKIVIGDMVFEVNK